MVSKTTTSNDVYVFVSHFQDVDHRVREASQHAMSTLVLRMRRNLAPFLRNLMGAWLISQCDTYPTVASAATMAFNDAFPPAKQTEAYVFCKESCLEVRMLGLCFSFLKYAYYMSTKPTGKAHVCVFIQLILMNKIKF